MAPFDAEAVIATQQRADFDASTRALYARILAGWNARSGALFAAPFAEDGLVIGFDGSQHAGRPVIASTLDRIFAKHETAAYVGRVRSVRPLGETAAVLFAVAGMVPPGQGLDPRFNAVQTLVAAYCGGEWRVVCFQNTPAQFDGRADLASQLTEELRRLPGAGG